MIESQSFIRPVSLDCDLHKHISCDISFLFCFNLHPLYSLLWLQCFYFLKTLTPVVYEPLLLRWERRLEGLEWRKALLPTVLRLWQSLCLDEWAFAMEKSPGVFDNGSSSPLLPEPWENLPLIFIHWENLVEFPEVKPTEVWGGGGDLQRLKPLEFLTLMLVHTQPPVIFQNYCLSVMAPATCTLDKLISAVTFWIHLFLQILEWQFILQTQFSGGSKKSKSVCPALSHKDKMTTFKLFACQSWNWK